MSSTTVQEPQQYNEGPMDDAVAKFMGLPTPREFHNLVVDDDRVVVLMEIVSASNLVSSWKESVDPYCVVRVGNEDEVHRTSTIHNDADPIWTIKTRSLCLIRIPKKKNVEATDEKHVLVEVCHDGAIAGHKCLGFVVIPFSEVLSKTGEREEFSIRTSISSDDSDDEIRGTLALRLKRAGEEDMKFLCLQWKSRDLTQSVGKEESADIHFKNVSQKTVWKAHKKTGTNGNKLFRVQPGPDPKRVGETQWMSKDAIQEEALKPSRTWVESGYGELGTLYAEIIGCDNLPNMDTGVAGDVTDPFVGLVMEGSFLRSSIIHDSLSPRWMPWSTRAFAFNISHPSSLLMIGLFDYDSNPLDAHDPIGRVVINTVNFSSNTSYLLRYSLQEDSHKKKDYGTIVIRLRLEWKNESEAIKKSYTRPPRFLINVHSQKSLSLLRYICRGSVNLEEASMESVKYYVNELKGYGKSICYAIDVLAEILLWRGRTTVLGFDVWFPIHSMVLLCSAATCIEFPTMTPVVFFYGISWIMLALNDSCCHNPYPWKQCKSVHETNIIMMTGRKLRGPQRIVPNQGVQEEAALDALDEVKAARVAGFLNDAKTVGLKVQKIYNKTDMTSYNIDTKDKKWTLLGGQLVYVHSLLFTLCTTFRMFRNLVNWKGYTSQKLTMTCFWIGTIWLLLPMHQVAIWVCRIVVWTFLGPWMKLVDILYVHPYYRTKAELMADPEFHGTPLESWLTSESIRKLGVSARIASEEALKLKDMREYKFGRLSQLIPSYDTSRYPSIPLPDSTAVPYYACSGSRHRDAEDVFVDLSQDEQDWCYVPGQKLEGNMVHAHLKVSEGTHASLTQ